MAEIRTISVDLTAFSLDSIKRAAYRFTDQFAADVHVDGDNAVCTLVFDEKTPNELVERTLSAFQKEILDQDLRARVREETRDVRNLILAHAFADTGLIPDESIPPP